MSNAAVAALPATDRLAGLVASWERHLRGRIGNGRRDEVSPRTVENYVEAADRLRRFLAGLDAAPASWAAVTTEHLVAFLDDLRRRSRRNSPGGAANRQRSLKVFFAWLVAEGEVETSPLAKLAPPAPSEKVTRCLEDAEHDRLWNRYASARTGDFTGRRNHALLRLFLATPGRLAELANLRVADVNLDRTPGEVSVIGKGRKPRVMHIGPETAEALDRYLRERDRLPGAGRVPHLWLSSRGRAGRDRKPLTVSAVQHLLQRLAAEAGVAEFHPHVTRHTWVHHAKSRGWSNEYIRGQGGWANDAMIEKIYGKAKEAERITRTALELLARGELR